MKRFLWLGCVLLIYVICTGCGDTFRPIIIPNPPAFPNPQAAHTVVAINDNAPASGPDTVFGTAMVIDVSGDTDESIANVGLAPVHAVQQSASEILVVNHSVTGAQRDSVTKLNFSGTSIASTSTISMPPNSAPNFVATTETTEAYVSMPNYLDPSTNTVVPSIAVVNTNTNSITNTIPLAAGAAPVAIVETPDTKKLYVANYGFGTISGFNTADESPRPINGTLSNRPIWLAARSDSQAAYVLESNGTLAWINASTTAGPDILAETAINVPGANMMTYDPNLLRLYIPGTQALAIIDISQSPPAYLAGGPFPTCLGTQTSSCIPTVPPASRSAGDPCTSTTAQALTIVAVAALPDGSRAYVGAYYTDSNDNICPQVTVIDATNNTIESPSIPIPGFPDATNATSAYYVAACSNTRDTPTVGPLGSGFRFMMGAGGDSTRVYLSSCDGGLVDIINTSTDAYLVNITAPIGIRPIIPPAPQNPPMNPVFLIAGP
jgi:hypothetical protein